MTQRILLHQYKAAVVHSLYNTVCEAKLNFDTCFGVGSYGDVGPTPIHS